MTHINGVIVLVKHVKPYPPFAAIRLVVINTRGAEKLANLAIK